jgi:hypothetical protein
MALPQNRPNVVRVLDVLRPMLIGRTIPAWTCVCGDVHRPAGTAVEIIPDHQILPRMNTMAWLGWNVRLLCDNGEMSSSELDDFFKGDRLPELTRLFDQYSWSTDNPFAPEIEAEDRAEQQLAPLVQIRQTDRMLTFEIAFGNLSRDHGVHLDNLLHRAKPFLLGEERRDAVLELLRTVVAEASVTRGGADPDPRYVIPGEPTWRTDGLAALEDAGVHDQVVSSGFHGVGRDCWVKGHINFLHN